MTAEAERELHLGDYLRALRRRRWAVVVVVGACLAISAASALETPVFSATAELLLQPRQSEGLFNPLSGYRPDPVRSVQTEIQVLKSRPVRDEVRRQLGDAPPISATPVGQTDVVTVTASSTDAVKAAAISNAYAKAYIDFRRKQAVDDLLAASKEVQGRVGDLQRQIVAATGVERDSLVDQQSLLKKKLDELQVNSALSNGGAQLVSEAIAPQHPVSPQPVRNVVLGLAIGLVLGVSLALFVDYLDDSVRGKDDLARALPDVSIMGFIPVVDDWKDQSMPRVVLRDDPTSPAAEAYLTLRTSIRFMGIDQGLRVLQVTSPNAREGKTTTLANIAVAMGRAGQRVIIVCCDLRRPRVHEFFGVSKDVGLTSVLLGEVSLADALQYPDGVERVAILATGPLPPNPSEVLQSARMNNFIEDLRGHASFVLIDSPPVLPVTDALILSKVVDGTVVVCAAGLTAKRELVGAVDLLRQVDANVTGIVLNGVTPDDAYGYSYQYYRSPYIANGKGPNGRASQKTVSPKRRSMRSPK